MQISDERTERLVRLSQAWSDAEQAIKIGEQALGEVVIPAVKELRYAGRKLARSLADYADDKDLAEADRKVEDVIFDCYRARHDATDAATAKIAIRLELTVKKMGAETVAELFPEYTDLRGLIASVRKKVANARREDGQRHDIYAEIELDELPRIIELYEKFLANEPHMKDKRWRSLAQRQGLTAGLILTVALLLWLNLR